MMTSAQERLIQSVLGVYALLLSPDTTGSFPSCWPGAPDGEQCTDQRNVHLIQRGGEDRAVGRVDVCTCTHAPSTSLTQQPTKSPREDGSLKWSTKPKLFLFSHIYRLMHTAGDQQYRIVTTLHPLSPGRKKITHPHEQRGRDASLHPHPAGVTCVYQ